MPKVQPISNPNTLKLLVLRGAIKPQPVKLFAKHYTDQSYTDQSYPIRCGWPTYNQKEG